MPTFREDLHLGHEIPLVNTDDIASRAITGDKLSDELWAEIINRGQYIEVYRGDWQPNTPYYRDRYDEEKRQYITDKVSHHGGMWLCLQSQPVTIDGVEVYSEPKFNSPYWMLVDTAGNYSIQFASSRGYSFRRGNVDTEITPYLYFGPVNITDDIPAEYWNWTRQTEQGKSASDLTWDAQHRGVKGLHLTNEEMPAEWSYQNKAIFTLTVTVYDGKDTIIVENQIIS